SLAVTQAAIAAQIHQALDVHRHGATQIALDNILTVDQFANAQHLVIGQLVHAARDRNADLVADLERLGAPDAVDVGDSDRNPLLIGYVDAGNARHLRVS